MIEDPTDEGADTIEITVPARVGVASTLRLLVAALGADAGFTVDEIDDLRLAVSEVFTSLVEAGEGGRCTAAFAVIDRTVRVTMGLSGDQPARVDLDPLAVTILSSVIDQYSIDGGTITLVKHGAESSANTG